MEVCSIGNHVVPKICMSPLLHGKWYHPAETIVYEMVSFFSGASESSHTHQKECDVFSVSHTLNSHKQDFS